MFVGVRIARRCENDDHPKQHRQPAFEKDTEFWHVEKKQDSA
jgi:hypothetical protein